MNFFQTQRADGPGWRPVREVVDDPSVLRARIEATRQALHASTGAAVEDRVAASIAQLGLVARLLAPAFALAVHDGRVVDLTDAQWQPVLGGPYPLSLDACTTHDPGDDLAGRFEADVLLGPIADITRAVQAQVPLADGLVRGNVASGLAGAAKMLATERPADQRAASDLLSELLARPALAGSAAPGRTTFRRTSCCLIYRLSEQPAYCGDCALLPA